MQKLSDIFAEESPKVEKTDSLDSFRFIFTDGQAIDNKAKNIEEATVLAVARRIQAGKHFNIMGAFAKEGKEMKMVKTSHVNLSLTPKM